MVARPDSYPVLLFPALGRPIWRVFVVLSKTNATRKRPANRRRGVGLTHSGTPRVFLRSYETRKRLANRRRGVISTHSGTPSVLLRSYVLTKHRTIGTAQKGSFNQRGTLRAPLCWPYAAYVQCNCCFFPWRNVALIKPLS